MTRDHLTTVPLTPRDARTTLVLHIRTVDRGGAKRRRLEWCAARDVSCASSEAPYSSAFSSHDFGVQYKVVHVCVEVPQCVCGTLHVCVEVHRRIER